MGMRIVAFAVALAVWCAPAQAARCSAQSPATITALVELYTSEGCDSCPPADEWLSSLGSRGYVPERVVPVALHVDYWDYIGWKDPYAKREFSARQRRHAAMQRARVVYTPQVLLQGRDFRAWHSEAFDRELDRINRQPALASIMLTLDTAKSGFFDVEAVMMLKDGVSLRDPALYLATYEDKLVSAVRAGENRGRTLRHDYVVLEWTGPQRLGSSRRLEERRSLPLLPKAVKAHSGVVAFVQDRATGQVLQALMLPACAN